MCLIWIVNTVKKAIGDIELVFVKNKIKGENRLSKHQHLYIYLLWQIKIRYFDYM
jgi:acid stress-induced BolA-like protein IbaG/YrbA